jgi:hypothetical protein
MLQSGEQVRGQRAREGLERCGGSPEGVTNPRVRRNLTRGGDRPSSERRLIRGGDRPSSEAESHPRGRSSPRARWGLVSTAMCPSSEAEFRSRAAGPTVLVGRWGHQGRGPLTLGRDYFERVLGFVNSFVFVFYERK